MTRNTDLILLSSANYQNSVTLPAPEEQTFISVRVRIIRLCKVVITRNVCPELPCFTLSQMGCVQLSSLLLVVLATVVAVEAGVTTFEQPFLSSGVAGFT